jgi:hypothetical protein
MLYYRKKRVNIATFKFEKKDLRRLVGFCEICEVRVVGQAAIPAPDGYASDVYGDNTLVVRCPRCRKAALDDI